MGQKLLPQVPRVAIVAQPQARMGSIGVFVDGLERVRAHIRRQYGAIDTISAADRFDIVEIALLASDRAEVMTEGKVRLPVQGVIDDRIYDVVVLADHAIDIADVMAAASDRLARWLQMQAGQGALIAASGAAVVSLAASGLLDGQRAAVPFWLSDVMVRRFPDVLAEPHARIVDEGRVLTSAGGSADVALALAVVEAITSPNSARWLARQLGLAVRPVEPSVDAAVGTGQDISSDPLSLRAQNWLAEHYSHSITIADLAVAMDVNRRTIHRHFVIHTGSGPLEYLQSLRVEAAKRMLERTPFSVERIAALVGYGDVAFFRRTFRRRTGQSPAAWRKASRKDA